MIIPINRISIPARSSRPVPWPRLCLGHRGERPPLSPPTSTLPRLPFPRPRRCMSISAANFGRIVRMAAAITMVAAVASEVELAPLRLRLRHGISWPKQRLNYNQLHHGLNQPRHNLNLPVSDNGNGYTKYWRSLIAVITVPMHRPL